MRKLKIVLTTRQFSPCLGGTETSVLAMANQLVSRGHSVTVLTLNRNIWNGQKLDPYENIGGISVVRIPYLNLGLRPIALCNPFWLFRFFARADIIHNHDIRFLFESCLVAKYWFRIPLVIGSHGFILHQKKLRWLKKFVFYRYYLPLFRLVDCVQAVSRQDLELIKNSLPPEQLALIPGGVDAETFAISERKPIAGRLLYFGRIDEHKGLDLLFDALAKVQAPYHLHLVFGSSRQDCLDDLLARAKKNGIEHRVSWLGKMELTALKQELSHSQMVVFPSRYEGFGLTVLEAMAAGCVVLANKIEAFRNIIENGKTGVLTDFSDPLTAAQDIERILKSPADFFSGLCEAAKAEADRHSWRQRGDQLTKLYECLVDRSGWDQQSTFEEAR